MTQIVSIGLDLVEIDRFGKLYGAFDPDVLDRCFTEREQAAVGGDVDRLARLAGRFAAKEAIIKTVGGLQDGISLTDIEIRSDGTGPPTARVTGGALAAANALGIKSWHISITHGRISAAAVALALGSPSA